MIIRKKITSVGIPSWKRQPCDWSDEMITMFTKRILRKTKSRRILAVNYEQSGWNVVTGDQIVHFEVEVGKLIEMSAKDRKAQLVDLLSTERVVASL